MKFQEHLAAPFGFKGRDSSDGPTQNESMDVVCALVGIDRLQVHHMPNDVVLIADTIPTEHIPTLSGNSESLSTVVALDERNHFRGDFIGILETADLETGLEAKSNL